jgi:Uma2 family endonuclease
MADPAKQSLSYQDYLALEESSPIKHEFFQGTALAMAGGSPLHAYLGTAISAMLREAFPQCRVYSADLRVQTPSELTTYPDCALICGPRTAAANDPNSATNPTLLVEVLSPGTAAYDRGEKFVHYQQISSLQIYLLISCNQQRIEAFQRQHNGWLYQTAIAGETLTLENGVSLSVDALYRGSEDA